jgi:heat-inducible transcriptional repressor
MILEDYGLLVSSATVRNDMNDLETAGYIEKPYASSGRIPTQKGYRFFVDWLLDLSELTKKERLEIVETCDMRCLEVGEAMRQTAFLLSNMTNYLGFVIPPRLEEARLDQVILARMKPQLALLAIISNIGMIEHSLIPLPRDLAEEESDRVVRVINDTLRGASLAEVSRQAAEADANGWSNKIGSETLSALHRLLESRMHQTPYFEGIFNLANLLRKTRLDRAMEQFAGLIQAIQDGGVFSTAIREFRQNKRGVIVAVGDCPLLGLDDYSVVTADFRPYSGVLGVIAPLWMDYSRALSVTSYIANRLEAVLVASCSWDLGRKENDR